MDTEKKKTKNFFSLNFTTKPTNKNMQMYSESDYVIEVL